MNASEHVAKALIHLEAAANAQYDHLLREQRHTEWNREVLGFSASASAARDLLTEVHAVWATPTESWTIPRYPIRHADGPEDSSWWTESQS